MLKIFIPQSGFPKALSVRYPFRRGKLKSRRLRNEHPKNHSASAPEMISISSLVIAA